MSVVESVMSRDISKASGHTISVDPVAVNAGSWCHTFTKPGVHPFDEIEWKIVDASIIGSGGKKVFEAKNIEVPGWWETNTINIVADKYFRVVSGQRETSVKQVFSRVASTIRKWADEQGYFNSKDDAHVYEMELIYALLHQYGAFNSPVWFNLGIPGRRQAASACFISSVDDTLDSIMEFQKAESVIFAGGSGSGANLSKIRSSYEKLASGSYTSGPLSWMRGLDQYAMAMKSGGSCLAPYQKVYTSSGPISVKELADSRSEFVVISWDPPANRYKAKKATAWHAGTKEVIRINTDKGSFDFSIDHPFKLSTGKFVRADELKVGMSLFSCAINKNDGGYLRVNLKDGKKGKELLHRMVAKDVSGSDTYRMSVHHKDGNKYNNAPDNLECMTDSEHITEHSKKLVEDGVHTFQTRKFPKIGSSNPMHRDSQFWKDAARVESYRKSKSDQLMGSGLAKEMQKLAASEKMLKTGYEIINSGGDVSSFEAFAKSRKTIVGKFASKKRLLESINNRFGSYGNYVNELSINNHRIVSIESVGTMDVYDVNVQCPTEDDKSVNTGHNFVVWSGDDLVGSGVVVANTRNAAKMVILDMDHPDIIETKDGRPGFVRCKAEEEILAHKLVGVGISAAYDDPNGAYKRVMFQNANHSVSIPDAFMQAVMDDGEWVTKERLTGSAVHAYKARDVWAEISKAAWVCGDPGVQFRDTINRWHTIPKTGPIVASNPCFAAETKIATEFGLVTISELYERIQDGQVNVSVHTGETIVSRPAIIFPTGINPILKIEFKSGRILNVTPNHTFLLRDGSRKPAAELESGDTVDIQCKEGQFGSYDLGLPESQEWYKIAGFMVGDGWMTHIKVDNSYHRKSDDSDQSYRSDRHEAGMCFGKDDKDILAYVTSFLDRNEVKYSLKRQTASVGESPDYLRIGRSGVFKALENVVSPRGCKSFTKRIQPGVFEASRHNQLAFMSGYLSADGTFRLSAKGHGGKIPTREMRLSSVNLELLQDVQALLLNLGIKSTIKQNRIKRSLGSRAFTYTSSNGDEKVYSSTRNCHELFIYGHSLRKLRDGMNEIGGMISSRKQGMLEDHLPSGHSEPVHDVWNDEVVSVSDTGREELTYNMTEFDTHTIIAEGVRIPQCSEYLNVDDSACNLCALNLTKFFDGRQFSVDRFAHATRLFSMAQMAIVDKADYPTDKIRNNSKKLRPIGTNYGDLGALLMKMGYAYDSDEGRVVAARLASLMTGLVYKTSAGIAARVGAFQDFEKNKDDMLQVIKMHQEADRQISGRWSVVKDPLGQDVLSKSAEVWKETLDLGYKYGYSICQATLQAPLGTISFLMGMDTTGIEPAFSLVSYKSMVGGGFMKIVNGATKAALDNLGLSESQVSDIVKFIEDNGTVEGAPHLSPNYYPIFETAMPSGPSGKCITPLGHIKMMAAIQPLITCAQSKTVNLPSSATPEEIGDIYLESWKLGIKCVALYRDGCKASQPLATKARAKEEGTIKDESKADEPTEVQQKPAEIIPKVEHTTKRRRMPDDVSGWRHKFDLDGYKGYIIVNEYEDGTPGEVFLKLGKPGSTVAGLIDGFTKLLSTGLQHGIPLERLIASFIETRFEPSGMTTNPKVRFAKSLYDYLFKLLDVHYYGGRISGLDHRLQAMSEPSSYKDEISRDVSSEIPVLASSSSVKNIDAPPCPRCGILTQRSGSCYLCTSCGSSTGCS